MNFESEIFLGEIVNFVNRGGITSSYARFMCWRRIIFSLSELELMFVNRRKISPSLMTKIMVCRLTSIVVVFVQGGDKLLWLWNWFVWRKLFFSLNFCFYVSHAAIKPKNVTLVYYILNKCYEFISQFSLLLKCQVYSTHLIKTNPIRKIFVMFWCILAYCLC